MRRRKPAWLVSLFAVACVIELIHAAGWLGWKSLQSSLAHDADSGARRMVESPLMVLPSTVFWSRRLVGSALAGADPVIVSELLGSVGSRQLQWMPTGPEGAENLTRAALLDGDLSAAVAHLEDALTRDPTSPYLHRLIAVLLRQTGHPGAFLDHMATAAGIAPTYCKPAVELTPEDELWIRRQGLRRRLELYPRDRVPGLLALAAELRRQGQEEQARLRLLEVDHDPTVQIQLAEWDIQAADFAAAATRATAVAVRSTVPSRIRARAYSVVARAKDLDGDEGGAVAAANLALGLAPSSPSPYLALASLAERRQDHEAALQHLRRAWGISPTNVSVLLRVARAAERSGHVPDARLALERAVELEPDRPDVAARLVAFQLRQHQYMEATMSLSRFLERFPTDPGLLRQTDRLRREVSRFERR